MGLAEKRALTEYQEKTFPQMKKGIDEAAGFDVPMEVRWDTMAKEGQGQRYKDWFGAIYFNPLTAALKDVAKDQMGKDALKTGLKKVVIDGSSGFNKGAFSFKAGVLTLLHEPDANVSDVADRTTGIIRLLESGL